MNWDQQLMSGLKNSPIDKSSVAPMLHSFSSVPLDMSKQRPSQNVLDLRPNPFEKFSQRLGKIVEDDVDWLTYKARIHSAAAMDRLRSWGLPV